MTSDAVLFFSRVPGIIWSLFTSFNIPGVGFSPGTLLFGIISIPIIVWTITNVFGFGANFSSKVANRPEDEHIYHNTTYVPGKGYSDSWTRSKRVK